MSRSGVSSRDLVRTRIWFVSVGLFALLMCARVIWQIVDGTLDSFGILAAVVLGVLLFVAALVFAFFYPQYQRLAALRRRYPDALLIAAVGGVEAAHAVSELLGVERARLGDYFVVMVDEVGVRYWKGRSRPRLLYTVPWECVEDVSRGEVVTTRVIPSVQIDARVDDRSASLMFAPCHSGWRIGFPYRNPDRTDEVVRHVRAAWRAPAGAR